MIKKSKSIFILLFLIPSLFFGCSQHRTPPTQSDIENYLTEHYDVVNMITQYLISLNYENVYVDDDSGIILADLEEISIKDEAVYNTMYDVMHNHIFKLISKRGNTIYFIIWSSFNDIGCGIAYSINGIDPPEITYMTELEPLSYEGWYYYVEDYNQWRVGKRPNSE